MKLSKETQIKIIKCGIDRLSFLRSCGDYRGMCSSLVDIIGGNAWVHNIWRFIPLYTFKNAKALNCAKKDGDGFWYPRNENGFNKRIEFLEWILKQLQDGKNE